MSSLSTVDGLVSGLNTSSIISQLMQVEAQPQTNLKTKVSTESTVVSAYQAVNTKMAAIKTAAEALTGSLSSSTWQAATVSSSSTTVTATASPGAVAGTAVFDVKQLAATHMMTAVVPATGVTGGAGLDLTFASGASTHLAITDDTPQGIADALNSSPYGIKASVITTDQGTSLQMTASQSGTEGTFSVAGFTGAGAKLAVQGQDAQIAVGGTNAGAYTISSPNNTFTTVIPNVSFTATAVQNGVTLTVGSDGDSIATKMQALVDAVNAAGAQMKTSTAYNATSKQGGPLTGDSTVRELQGSLLSAVSQGYPGYGSFKDLGLQLDSSGTLTFDKSAFLSAYNANPSAVQDAVSNGIAATYDDVASKATDFADGSLTTAIQSHNNTVTSLNDEITDWNTRLTAKQAALQQQFANLETALGKMKDQSSWLSGQLAGLPTGGSG